jgi:hypothetical protein
MLDVTEDFSGGSDEVLQDSLDRLFVAHAEAADSCDRQAQAEAHAGIAAILLEQSRRLDAWIEGMRAAHA